MSDANNAVFLSYAREDADAARRIAEALRGFGVEVWFDQGELRGGDAWDEKIRSQIRSCALFLAIISAHTQARREGYFRREWKLAVERTHDMAEGVPFVVPVVIDETDESRALVPGEFLRVQWTRLPGGLPSPQFIEQVKRLLGQTSEVARAFQPVGSGDTGWKAGATPKGGRRVPPAAWVAAIVVLIAGGLFWWHQAGRSPDSPPNAGAGTRPPTSERPASPSLDPHRIAVLPLDNFSPDANDEYLAGGMTEELTSSLSKISGLEVIARTSSEVVKKARKGVAEIGAELRVGTLLEGSVSKAGDQLRISVQLIDVASQRNLWSENYNTELKDVFKMRTEVAGRVAEALKVKLLGSEVQRLKKEPTADLEAYRLYVLGRYLWNKRTGAAHEKAIAYFNQALARDPLYAEAQTGLGLCFVTNFIRLPNKEAMAKARAAAMKALELDPTLGEAHAVLGSVLDCLYDWTGAEKEYRLAILLSPNSATAHQWFGEHFEFLRRFDEALGEIRRAQELDPLSLIIISAAAWTLKGKGQFDDAIQACRKGLELDPDFAELHRTLGWIYITRHLFADALTEFGKMRALDPAGSNGLPGLGYVLARSGDKVRAFQVLNELEELGKKGFEVRNAMAFVYLGLGETEKTLESFELALAAGEFIGWINTAPNLEELRPNPRFQALLRKMNLVP